MTELTDSSLAASPAQISCTYQIPRLPLAVYREIAAHLRQVEGVQVDLLPQTATEFDYLQSQVGGIRVAYAAAIAPRCRPQVAAILAYYAEHYGVWQSPA